MTTNSISSISFGIVVLLPVVVFLLFLPHRRSAANFCLKRPRPRQRLYRHGVTVRGGAGGGTIDSAILIAKYNGGGSAIKEVNNAKNSSDQPVHNPRINGGIYCEG